MYRRAGLGHVGGVKEIQERGQDGALGHTGGGIKGIGIGVLDADIGRAVRQEGGNQTDIIGGEGVGMELIQETEMPYAVIGLLHIEGDEDGGTTGVQLMGEEVGEAEELIIGGEGWPKATLGDGEGKVSL